MPQITIIRLALLRDNYSYLLRHAQANLTAAVDPAQAPPVLAACQERGWTLTHIWNTHHHVDHTGGNLALKDMTGACVVGPARDAKRIPGLDVAVSHGQAFSFGGIPVRMIGVPGHTLGHIAFHLPTLSTLFCGDALFALGCGRMFEGTAPQFWESLCRIKALADDTLVYCAHEYTEANLAFARHMDPHNAALAERGDHIKALRAAGQATTPSLLGEEKVTNPFLRADDAAFAAQLGLAGCPASDVFAHLRSAKDHFKPL